MVFDDNIWQQVLFFKQHLYAMNSPAVFINDELATARLLIDGPGCAVHEQDMPDDLVHYFSPTNC
jgi:hypothetical protein